MQQPFLYQFHEQNFWLNTQKFIFWEQEKTIILSDLHLTKSGHFRKNGIAVPQQILKEDLHQLFNIISFYKPKQLIVVGDLFHSTANKELDLFVKWRNDFTNLTIHLVKGNHDILKEEWYLKANINVHSLHFLYKQFCFVHDINDKKNIEPSQSILYTFSGHVHPSIEIKIAAKQRIQLPCFYFGKKFAILPAFGRFTGLHKVKPTKADKVFAIVNNSIIKIQ